MKFTKEDACKEITAIFGKKVEKIDRWERTIKENVDTLFSLLGDSSEMELGAFCDNAVAILSTTSGFINKEYADFVKNYKPQVKEEPPKGKNPSNDDGEETAIEKRLRELEERLAKRDLDETIKIKRKEIIAHAKSKGVKNDEWLKEIVGKTAINDQTDVEKEAEDFVKIYNSFKAQVDPTPTPGGAGGGAGNEAAKVISAAAEIAKARNL